MFTGIVMIILIFAFLPFSVKAIARVVGWMVKQVQDAVDEVKNIGKKGD